MTVAHILGVQSSSSTGSLTKEAPLRPSSAPQHRVVHSAAVTMPGAAMVDGSTCAIAPRWKSSQPQLSNSQSTPALAPNNTPTASRVAPDRPASASRSHAAVTQLLATQTTHHTRLRPTVTTSPTFNLQGASYVNQLRKQLAEAKSQIEALKKENSKLKSETIGWKSAYDDKQEENNLLRMGLNQQAESTETWKQAALTAQLQVENAALEQFRLQQQVEMGALEEFRRLNGSSPDGAANGAKAFSTGLTTSLFLDGVVEAGTGRRGANAPAPAMPPSPALLQPPPQPPSSPDLPLPPRGAATSPPIHRAPPRPPQPKVKSTNLPPR